MTLTLPCGVRLTLGHWCAAAVLRMGIGGKIETNLQDALYETEWILFDCVEALLKKTAVDPQDVCLQFLPVPPIFPKPRKPFFIPCCISLLYRVCSLLRRPFVMSVHCCIVPLTCLFIVVSSLSRVCSIPKPHQHGQTLSCLFSS